MDEKIKLLQSTIPVSRLKFDEPLKYQTYTKLEEIAKVLYIATTKKELIEILNLSFDIKIPFIVLGNGTKIIATPKLEECLVIKNRTSSIKIGGIKGHVSKDGIGIKEALLEVDSGVSINKLNEYLKSQKLKEFQGSSPLPGTLGSTLFFDVDLQSICQKVTIWQDGDIFETESFNLNQDSYIVLSLVLQVKVESS